MGLPIIYCGSSGISGSVIVKTVGLRGDVSRSPYSSPKRSFILSFMFLSPWPDVAFVRMVSVFGAVCPRRYPIR
ncbi:MAG: hypothetical protein ACLR56_13580 [Oscillospiraceae bacterium]